MTKKVTKKDRFNTIINLLNGALDFGYDPDVDVDEIIAFCEGEIATLDKRAERAKKTAAEKKETDPLREAVFEILPAEFTTIDDITTLVSGDDVTRSKVSNRLSKLAAAGLAEKGELSVTGSNGKSKKVVAYRTVPVEAAE